MARKTILLLGASTYQLDALRCARRIGYRVIAVDNRPDNPGHKEADFSYHIDTTDVAGVLSVARREGVNGVISPCTDVAVVTAAIVARELALCGAPVESAAIVTDKSRFRSWLRDQALPCPDFEEVSESSDVSSEWFRGGLALMKPARSSGSKGIKIVSDRDEFLGARSDALSVSLNRRGLLERFINGRQGTCEGALEGGRIAFACLTDRVTVSPPYVATCGHMVPSTLSPGTQRAVLDSITSVWARLGVTQGPFDCDFVVGEDGLVYLIELSPRLGGNSLSTLVQMAFGLDIVEYAVRSACGDPAPLSPRRIAVPTAQLVLGVDCDGLLSFDRVEAAALAAEPWVKSLSFDYAMGTRVSRFTNGRLRVGEAAIQAESRDLLDARVDEFRRRLALCGASCID